MEDGKLAKVLEALIMSSPEPVKFDRLCHAVKGDADRREVRKTLGAMQEELAAQERGYRLKEIAGGYQFLTAVEYASYVRRLKSDAGRKRDRGGG